MATDLKSRIDSYKKIKEEFYKLKVDDDENIDKYIKMLMAFNDEFIDISGELGMPSISVNQDGNFQEISSKDIESMISLAKTFIGCRYIWGASGEIRNGKRTFDCSGFVTFLLKSIGIMPQSAGRLTVASIPNSGYFTSIKWSSMKRGDILCKFTSKGNHVVIYEGNNRIIHAANKKPYPAGGVKESNLYFDETDGGKAFRIIGLGVE